MSRELHRRLAKIEAKRAIDPISLMSDEKLDERIQEIIRELEAEHGPDWRLIAQEEARSAGMHLSFAEPV